MAQEPARATGSDPGVFAKRCDLGKRTRKQRHQTGVAFDQTICGLLHYVGQTRCEHHLIANALLGEEQDRLSPHWRTIPAELGNSSCMRPDLQSRLVCIPAPSKFPPEEMDERPVEFSLRPMRRRQRNLIEQSERLIEASQLSQHGCQIDPRLCVGGHQCQGPAIIGDRLAQAICLSKEIAPIEPGQAELRIRFDRLLIGGSRPT